MFRRNCTSEFAADVGLTEADRHDEQYRTKGQKAGGESVIAAALRPELLGAQVPGVETGLAVGSDVGPCAAQQEDNRGKRGGNGERGSPRGVAESDKTGGEGRDHEHEHNESDRQAPKAGAPLLGCQRGHVAVAVRRTNPKLVPRERRCRMHWQAANGSPDRNRLPRDRVPA